MKILNNLLTVLIVAGGLYFVYDLAFNRAPKYDSGEVAPDFESVKPDGSKLKLSDLKGKYVLIDFWGSWCAPCRRENVGLVALYNKYHGEGLEILSVGMERSKERWLKAIQQDGLVWDTHVSDLKRMGGKVGRLYKIREIPTKYLIDGEGQIIGVNLTVAEIDRLLAQKLAYK